MPKDPPPPTGPCTKWKKLHNEPLTEQLLFHRIFDDLEAANLFGCIAGGAATDFEVANDIDVFLFSASMEDANKLFQLWSKDGEADDDYCNCENYPDDSFILFGVAHPYWSSKPIQVILSNQPGPLSLMMDFDLSVHMRAVERIGGTLEYIKGEGATGTDEPIKVYKKSLGTKKRLAKLTQRYGVKEAK
jgi:hypothetical protein